MNINPTGPLEVWVINFIDDDFQGCEGAEFEPLICQRSRWKNGAEGTGEAFKLMLVRQTKLIELCCLLGQSFGKTHSITACVPATQTEMFRETERTKIKDTKHTNKHVPHSSTKLQIVVPASHWQ